MKGAEFWDVNAIKPISGDKIGRNIRELTTFLDGTISQMTEMAGRYAPLELLKYLFFDMHRMVAKEGNSSRRLYSAAMRFTQQAICEKRTFKDGFSSDREIPAKELNRYCELFEQVEKQSVRFIDNITLEARNHIESVSPEVVSRFQKDCYDRTFFPCLDESRLESCKRAVAFNLQPYDNLIRSCFHAGAHEIVEAFALLYLNGRHGLEKMLQESSEYKIELEGQVLQAKRDGVRFINEYQLRKQIIKEKGWEDRVASITGRREGYDLFDVQKLTGLDTHDCTILSIPVGSLDEGNTLYPFEQQNGIYRPFVEYQGRFYCFDTEHLLDACVSIIRHHLIASGLISLKEWEETSKKREVLQTITLIHTSFGVRGFELDVDGYQALFEFPREKKAYLCVLGSAEHDPLYESALALEDMHKENAAILKARAEELPVLVVDMSRTCFYKVRAHDNVVLLSFVQLMEVASDFGEVKRCKEALGLIDPEGPVEAEAIGELENQLARAAIAEIEEKFEEKEKEEMDIQDKDEQVVDLDEKLFSQEEKAEETAESKSGGYSLFTLLGDIAKGDDPRKPAEKDIQNESEEEVEEEFEEIDLEDDSDDFIEEFLDEEEDEDALEESDEAETEDEDEAEADDEVEDEVVEALEETEEADPAEEDESEEDEELLEEAEEDEIEEALEEDEEILEEAEEAEEVEADHTDTEEALEEEEEILEDAEEEVEEAPEEEDVEEEVKEEIEAEEEIEEESEELEAEEESLSREAIEAQLEMMCLSDLVELSDLDKALEGRTIPALYREILSREEIFSGPLFEMCKQAPLPILETSASLIKKGFEAQITDRKDKMFTIFQYGITVIISAGRDDQMSKLDRRTNIGAIMALEKRESWNSLTLNFNDDGTLNYAKEIEVKKTDFSDRDWRFVAAIGAKMRAKREKR